jgi:hypothetical protein
MAELKFDMSCKPFPKWKLYWAVNVPYMVLLVATAIYVWQFNVTASVVYMSFYVLSVILHGYVCAFSGCPYKGGVCPGAFAYFPVGIVAGFFGKLKVRQHNALVGAFFAMCIGLLLGIMTLPLYWLSKSGIYLAIGYPVIVLAYLIVFLLTVCPRCAMRFNCPAARLSNLLSRRFTVKGILDIPGRTTSGQHIKRK